MKQYALLLTIFVLVHTSQGDHVRSYEGQTPETIKSLLSGEGKSGDFISQKEYQDFIKALVTEAPLDPVKDQALSDAKNSAKSPDQRIDALIQVLDLN